MSGLRAPTLPEWVTDALSSAEWLNERGEEWADRAFLVAVNAYRATDFNGYSTGREMISMDELRSVRCREAITEPRKLWERLIYYNAPAERLAEDIRQHGT